MQGRREFYQKQLENSPRMYRAAQAADGLEQDAAAVVLRCVIAPALGCFVQWLLGEAVASGKKRLYFLARDGYLMYRAALVFCRRYHLPIDCRYVSCSRYSLRLPLFHLDHKMALDFVCRGGIGVTLQKILARAALTEEEQRAVIEELSFSLEPDEPILASKLPQIRERLSGCGQFLTFMDRHSREALPGLAGYLRQEGFLEEIPDAVVDSGWVGSMQKTLGRALAYLGRGQRLEGYYWGLYEVPSDAERGEYHCYYFAPEGQLREKVYFNNCVFEAIVTAPHGMTLGYRKEGERYVPWYGEVTYEKKAFLWKTEACLLKYIECLAAEPDGWKAERSEQAVVGRLLGAFLSCPEKEEAEAFGNLPFSDDVLEGGEQPIAAHLTEEELAANHALPKLLSRSGLRAKTARESAWYEGSAVLYGKRVRRHLRQYALYQYLRFWRKRGR